MKRLLLLCICLLTFLPAVTTHAQTDYVPLAPLPGIDGGEEVTVSGYFSTIYQIGVSLVLVIAVVMLIYGGIQYMMSDSIGGKSGGRETIGKAIIGIVLAVSSYALLYLIGGSGSVTVGFDVPNVGYVAPPGGESTDSVTVSPEEPMLDPNETETQATPTANAGPNKTITLPSSVSLSGSATDDGLPGANLTTTWSKVSGPGTVTFANSSNASTTATFSQSGTYVLRLTAFDGALSDTDDVTVTVNSQPVSPDAHTLGPQDVQSTAVGLGTHFASPTGSGTSCTSTNPCSLQTAASQATAGSVVFLRNGTYPLTAQLSLTRSGTSSNPIIFESYPGERAIIDGQGNAGTRVKLEANYIVLRNVDVTRMADSAGVYILNGNNNLIDGVRSYNNRYSGFGIYTPYVSVYTQGSNNIIRNCVAYGNSDVGVEGGSNGGDSDGVSISSGDNNKVLNCLVYGNSDDGIDAWRSTNSEFAYNIIHSNGFGAGNGNGIKAGGPAPGNGALVHHNISYNNRATGIDQNGGTGISFFNNVSWDNNSGYVIGSDTVVRNNVSLGNALPNYGTGIASNNTWNGGFSVSSADFESIDPNSDFFFVLKPGSDLVNTGVNVGLSFSGSAPDIGAVESGY